MQPAQVADGTSGGGEAALQPPVPTVDPMVPFKLGRQAKRKVSAQAETPPRTQPILPPPAILLLPAKHGFTHPPVRPVICCVCSAGLPDQSDGPIYSIYSTGPSEGRRVLRRHRCRPDHPPRQARSRRAPQAQGQGPSRRATRRRRKTGTGMRPPPAAWCGCGSCGGGCGGCGL